MRLQSKYKSVKVVIRGTVEWDVQSIVEGAEVIETKTDKLRTGMTEFTWKNGAVRHLPFTVAALSTIKEMRLSIRIRVHELVDYEDNRLQEADRVADKSVF